VAPMLVPRLAMLTVACRIGVPGFGLWRVRFGCSGSSFWGLGFGSPGFRFLCGIRSSLVSWLLWRTTLTSAAGTRRARTWIAAGTRRRPCLDIASPGHHAHRERDR